MEKNRFTGLCSTEGELAFCRVFIEVKRSHERPGCDQDAEMDAELVSSGRACDE